MAWRSARGGSFRSPMGEGPKKLRALAIEASGAPPALVVAGLVLERTAKEMVSQPGKGKTYTATFITIGTGAARKVIPVGTRSKPHRAAAPGDPPAVDSGAGRNSIGHEIVGDLLRVGSALDYMGWQELGTDRMPSHPWLRPSFVKCQAQMTDVLVSELKALPTLRG